MNSTKEIASLLSELGFGVRSFHPANEETDGSIELTDGRDIQVGDDYLLLWKNLPENKLQLIEEFQYPKHLIRFLRKERKVAP